MKASLQRLLVCAGTCAGKGPVARNCTDRAPVPSALFAQASAAHIPPVAASPPAPPRPPWLAPRQPQPCWALWRCRQAFGTARGSHLGWAGPPEAVPSPRRRLAPAERGLVPALGRRLTAAIPAAIISPSPPVHADHLWHHHPGSDQRGAQPWRRQVLPQLAEWQRVR